jgi:alginate O-acetyltransferase complex protein AlgJ
MNLKLLALVFALSISLVAADPGVGLREAAAAKSAETPVVKGSDGWLFLPAELRHVSVGKFWGEDAAKVSKATKPENADPLPAILDFKKQLDAADVELILLPVPSKAFVYPEALGVTPAGRADTFHQKFYDELRKNGVTVIDLLPDLFEQRNSVGGLVYCKTDTHWSGAGIRLASAKVAALLTSKPWMKNAAKIKTSTFTRELEITGDLQRMSGGAGKELALLRFVGTEASAGVTAVPPDRASPVVLLGDSHTLVFHAGADMLASGAGLPDQLLHDLGIPVDLVGVRGSGATPARINFIRRVRGDSTYLAGKKVVIWCFTVREFTESQGWSVVPLLAK